MRFSSGHEPAPERSFNGYSMSGHLAPSIPHHQSSDANATAKRSGNLAARTLEINDIDDRQITQMWGLFNQYYADVSFERFVSDLRAKHSIILLIDSGDQSIQGFSTIQVYERMVDGKRFLAVYSGDTLIDRRYWGQTALQKAFFLFLMRLKLRNPLTTVWWFLISKGYKTYLLLARGCPEHWPRYEQETPEWPKAVMNALAAEKFGNDWQPEAGVIRFSQPVGRLKEGVAPVNDELLSIDEIRFFAERNPGHAEGDELVCLGRINARLAAYYVKKLLGKHWRKAFGGQRPEARHASSSFSRQGDS